MAEGKKFELVRGEKKIRVGRRQVGDEREGGDEAWATVADRQPGIED